MEPVYIVIVLALLQFVIFSGVMGWARIKYNVTAPASIGTIKAIPIGAAGSGWGLRICPG